MKSREQTRCALNRIVIAGGMSDYGSAIALSERCRADLTLKQNTPVGPGRGKNQQGPWRKQ